MSEPQDLGIFAGRRVIAQGRDGLGRPPRPRPEHAQVTRLLALIERRHARDVDQLRRQAFRAEPASAANPPPGLAANSLTDRHCRVSVVLDLQGTDDAPGWPPNHQVVTVSVAGHHRTLPGRRLHVDPAEEEAWVRAVLGPAWAAHAYAAGSLTRINNDPGAEQFKLVLDEQRRPTNWPADGGWPFPLRPLDAEAQGPTASGPQDETTR